jgi:hypothetical protein
MEDAAIFDVSNGCRRPNLSRDREFDGRAIGTFCDDGEFLVPVQAVVKAVNRDPFRAVETERLPRVTVDELERQDTHPDEVVTEDALVALSWVTWDVDVPVVRFSLSVADCVLNGIVLSSLIVVASISRKLPSQLIVGASVDSGETDLRLQAGKSLVSSG